MPKEKTISEYVSEAVLTPIHQLIDILKGIEKTNDSGRLLETIKGLLEPVRFHDNGYLDKGTVNSDLRDDTLFYVIVRIAVNVENITPDLIVDNRPGTRLSVQNWINNTHAPEQTYRILLFRFFVEELTRRLPPSDSDMSAGTGPSP